MGGWAHASDPRRITGTAAGFLDNPAMSSSNDIDRYFTEQIVGEIEVVEMGPAGAAMVWSEHGVWIDRLTGQAELMEMTARSLWARDPASALAGRPLALADLKRTRWGVAALLLTLWSVALYSLFGLIHG